MRVKSRKPPAAKVKRSLEFLRRLRDPSMCDAFPFLAEMRILAAQTPEPHQSVANPAAHQAILSPLRMTLFDDRIVYAESCQVAGTDLSLVYEFIFKKSGEAACIFAVRFMNAGKSPVPEGLNATLLKKMQGMAESLKKYCETIKAS